MLHQNERCARRFALGALAAMAVMPCAALAADAAASYPTKPIRILIGFGAGGPVDLSTRVIAKVLAESWKQQVITDNRPSAGGIIAAQTVAGASPDGYTLLAVSASHAVAPAIYAKLPYDTVKDFAGITTTISLPLVLVVSPGAGAKSVKDLISMARAKPGHITVSSSGIGSATHFAAELFSSLAGINVLHVPYKSNPEQVTEVMAGRVQFALAPTTNAMPFIRDGKLLALAVSPSKRIALLPEIPTLMEAGVAGYQWQVWFGLLAPAKTPRPLVAKLNQEVSRVLNLPESKERWNALGADPVPIAAEAFDKLVSEQIVLFTRLAKTANITAD